jgi:tetratricopeptide (TPR) repeat protein
MFKNNVLLIAILFLLNCSCNNISLSKNENNLTNESIINDRFLVESGQKKIKLNDYKGAVEDFTEAIRVNPKNIEAYNERARVKSYMSDSDYVNDYLKIIEIDPNNIDAYFSLYYISSQNINLGLKDSEYYLTKIIEIDPNNIKAYMYLAYNKSILNKQEAIAIYSKILEIDSKNINALNSRAWQKMELGDYRGATLDYTKVIDLQPKESGAYYNRAYAKKKIP